MDAVSTPQPPPAASSGSVVDDLVVLLHSRRDFGRRKYGTELQPFNGRDAYIDALQELLDLFQYLHQAQMERARLERDLARVTEERDAARENHLKVMKERDEAVIERDRLAAEQAVIP